MSDSEDENYAAFGTPLEPLDEENLPRKKAATIEDQYAYDTQGRRRFHGAFTGGFSAGYFNTVGTRDGWIPQQFKSSRDSKAKVIEQQPEDFMDEEDISIFGIAPKAIRANSDYEYHGQKGTKRGRAEVITNQSLSHNPVLKELLRPVRETVGIILLKKMGWKPGQGIGNRITRREKYKARRCIEKVKIYGSVSPQGKDKEVDSNIDDSDEDTANMTFAPDDYDPFRFKGKDNYFGIGYSGLNRQNVLSTSIGKECNYQNNNKSLPIFGHAFGVGAFEVDDDDIYEREDMSRYDSVLEPERKSKTRWSVNNILSNDKVNDCIDGFVCAIDKLNCKKIFALPHLPKDYHHAAHLARKSRFYPPIPHKLSNEKKKILSVVDRCRILSDVNLIDKAVQQKLDSNEKVLTCKISVTASNLATESLNSLKQQDTEDDGDLEKLRTRTNTSWVNKLNAKEFVSGGVTGIEQITPGLLSKSKNLNECYAITDVDKQIYKIPFSTGTGLDKQKNFEFSLDPSEIDDKHKLEKMEQVQSLAKWEKDQKLVEFKEAAKLIEVIKSNDTNEKGSNDYGTKVINGSEKEVNETTTIEMFGKLTREISEWQPASIVCKRFNVLEPKNSCVQIKSEKKLKMSVFNSLNLDMLPTFLKADNMVSKDIQNEISTTTGDELITNHPSTSFTHFNICNNEVQIVTEKEKNFEASYEKIFGKTVYDKYKEAIEEKFEDNKAKVVCIKNSEEKKDLYRSIFLSSSDESETEGEEDMDKEVVKSVLIGDTLNDINVTRNMSPPRGIFAKLDLCDLVIKPENVSIGNIEENIKNKQTNLLPWSEPQTTFEKNFENDRADTLQMSIPPDVYGPMLPSRLIKDGNALTDPVESTEFAKPIYKSVVIPKVAEKFQGQWVEVCKTKKSKKIKKKHKHKEHKSSKSKRKSKKHKH